LEENRQLLQLLARYIVEENNPVPEEVSLTLLGCLIPQGNALLSPSSEGMPFAELMSILSTLASAGSGIGHVQLFRTAAEWLSTCRYFGRFCYLYTGPSAIAQCCDCNKNAVGGNQPI
jgi:E3 ubiquitin-protein ligase UBR4